MKWIVDFVIHRNHHILAVLQESATLGAVQEINHCNVLADKHIN